MILCAGKYDLKILEINKFSIRHPKYCEYVTNTVEVFVITYLFSWYSTVLYIIKNIARIAERKFYISIIKIN